MTLCRACAALCLLLAAADGARAQTGAGADQPGPWVLDLRGVTVSLPSDPAFLPGLPAGSVVPGRGFGFDGGARWFWRRLGPSRLGLGLDATWARGTTPGSATLPRVVETFVRAAPDLSFNFGGRNGWSYLSLGAGVARIAGSATLAGRALDPVTSGAILAIHGGAGARWFTTDRLAVGFDVRLHQLQAGDRTPATMRFAASVGLSVR
ncbi:MAG: hypothetical protein AB7I25_00390 [Vicinamibacterales bacterium]